MIRVCGGAVVPAPPFHGWMVSECDDLGQPDLLTYTAGSPLRDLGERTPRADLAPCSRPLVSADPARCPPGPVRRQLRHRCTVGSTGMRLRSALGGACCVHSPAAQLRMALQRVSSCCASSVQVLWGVELPGALVAWWRHQGFGPGSSGTLLRLWPAAPPPRSQWARRPALFVPCMPAVLTTHCLA
jgi:hypothetical protein